MIKYNVTPEILDKFNELKRNAVNHNDVVNKLHSFTGVTFYEQTEEFDELSFFVNGELHSPNGYPASIILYYTTNEIEYDWWINDVPLVLSNTSKKFVKWIAENNIDVPNMSPEDGQLIMMKWVK